MRSICGSPNCEQPTHHRKSAPILPGKKLNHPEHGRNLEPCPLPTFRASCLLCISAAPGCWRSCKQSLQGGLGGQGADRGGWQSVKRNIPRPKKVGGPLLVAAERIPGCNLSAATWCRSTQRERSCAATFDLRRRLDQIATKSKLRSK